MVFNTLQEALFFTFNLKGKANTVDYNRVRNSNAFESGVNLAAEAAYVQLNLENIGQDYFKVLCARYKNPFRLQGKSCEHCGACEYDPDWIETVFSITFTILKKEMKHVHDRLLFALTKKYFNRKNNRTLDHIAARFGASVNTVKSYWVKVKKRLKKLESEAQRCANDTLIQQGIIINYI